MQVNNDDYLKELDMLFNSALIQHNLIKLQASSNSSAISTSSNSSTNSSINANNSEDACPKTPIINDQLLETDINNNNSILFNSSSKITKCTSSSISNASSKLSSSGVSVKSSANSSKNGGTSTGSNKNLPIVKQQPIRSQENSKIKVDEAKKLNANRKASSLNSESIKSNLENSDHIYKSNNKIKMLNNSVSTSISKSSLQNNNQINSNRKRTPLTTTSSSSPLWHTPLSTPTKITTMNNSANKQTRQKSMQRQTRIKSNTTSSSESESKAKLKNFKTTNTMSTKIDCENQITNSNNDSKSAKNSISSNNKPLSKKNSSILKDKINHLTMTNTSSNIVTSSATNTANSSRKSSICSTTSSIQSTASLSKSTISSTNKQQQNLSKVSKSSNDGSGKKSNIEVRTKKNVDDTDLDVSISNYSKISSDSKDHKHQKLSDDSEKKYQTKIPKLTKQISTSSTNSKRSLKAIKILSTAKNSNTNLAKLIQKKKQNLLNNIQMSNVNNRPSLMSLINSINANYYFQTIEQNQNLNNFLSELLLMNLIQFNLNNANNTNSSILNDFLAKFANLKIYSTTTTSFSHNQASPKLAKPKKRSNNLNKTNNSQNKFNKHDSLSSSMCSLPYNNYDDEIIDEMIDFENQSLLDAKSTSTKIEKNHSKNDKKKNFITRTNSNCPVEIPEIDDPILFIDNLYNQILAANNNNNNNNNNQISNVNYEETFTSTSSTTSNTNSSSRQHNKKDMRKFLHKNHNIAISNASVENQSQTSLTSNTFNLNNDFSFIDLYSNATQEMNTIASLNNTIKDYGKNLIDWNYEDYTNNNEEGDEENNQFNKANNIGINSTIVSSNEDKKEDTSFKSCECKSCTNETNTKNTNVRYIRNSRNTFRSSNPNLKNEHFDNLGIIHSLNNTSHDEPNWLMLKLLNSCSNLNETENQEDDEELKRIMSPKISSLNWNKFSDDLNLNIRKKGFVPVGGIENPKRHLPANDLNSSIVSIKSSASTQYIPIVKPKFHVVKKSYLFKPCDSFYENFGINVTKKSNSEIGELETKLDLEVDNLSQENDQLTLKSDFIARTTNTMHSYILSIVKSIKYLFFTKNMLIIPIILVLINLKLKRSNYSISSASPLSMSNVMQTSSLTTAARASATAAATATLNSIFSYYKNQN